MIARRFKCLILFCPFLLLASSWGFKVHRVSHQLAVYILPSGDLQNLFYKNIDYLEYNAPRPDIRQKKDKKEAPRHYINFETYGKDAASSMPLKWEDAVKKYTKDTLLKAGYLPYHVIYMKNKLTNAFKNKNKDSILFYATDLGHYIEDAHVPLHTTINYDGQLTGQTGLHNLWESTLPELQMNAYRLNSLHKTTYLPDPEKAIWEAVRNAHALLPDIYAKEKEVSRNFSDSRKYYTRLRNGKEYKTYSSAFAKAYATSMKNIINTQIISSANLVADFWYTCWIDAGKPDLSSLYSGKLNAKERENLQKDLNAFRNNALIKRSIQTIKKK